MRGQGDYENPKARNAEGAAQARLARFFLSLFRLLGISRSAEIRPRRPARTPISLIANSREKRATIPAISRGILKIIFRPRESRLPRLLGKGIAQVFRVFALIAPRRTFAAFALPQGTVLARDPGECRGRRSPSRRAGGFLRSEGT